LHFKLWLSSASKENAAGFLPMETEFGKKNNLLSVVRGQLLVAGGFGFPPVY